MSVLVYTENWDGKFKKLSFELVSYAAAVAEMLNAKVTAVTIGKADDNELKKLGDYGAERIMNLIDDRLTALITRPTHRSLPITRERRLKVIIFANNNTGKALAPRFQSD